MKIGRHERRGRHERHDPVQGWFVDLHGLRHHTAESLHRQPATGFLGTKAEFDKWLQEHLGA